MCQRAMQVQPIPSSYVQATELYTDLCPIVRIWHDGSDFLTIVAPILTTAAHSQSTTVRIISYSLPDSFLALNGEEDGIGQRLLFTPLIHSSAHR
jgi:hypothetical protein